MSSQYPVPKWIEQLHAGKEEKPTGFFLMNITRCCVYLP